ncbi:hypothetical protein QL285_063097 [Trifolium repens]|nr:hypothetical protein QL285_063097 [Trifolium repens]
MHSESKSYLFEIELSLPLRYHLRPYQWDGSLEYAILLQGRLLFACDDSLMKKILHHLCLHWMVRPFRPLLLELPLRVDHFPQLLDPLEYLLYLYLHQ